MKRVWSILLCLVLILGITASGNSNPAAGEDGETTENVSEVETDTTEAKIAVVCFSGTGNTMAIAEMIADVTGGDLFLDTYDLTDAVIYTFCTSGGSGIEKSINDLQTLYPDLQIVTGKRLNNASEEDVMEWISSLDVQQAD